MGGIERQVHDLALHQHERGDQVEIVTNVRDTVDRSGPTAAGVLPVHRPPGQDSRPAIRYLASLTGSRHAVRRLPDVIHLHLSSFSPLGFLAAGAASRAGVPTAVTLHSLWDYATPLFRGSDSMLRWRSWPLAWSAVSSAAAEPLQELLGPRHQVSVLPNGIDPDYWRIGWESQRQTPIRLVSVMRLVARKRPFPLLRILRQVRALVPAEVDLQAVVIGDGPHRRRLQRALRRQELDNWVQLPGSLPAEEVRAALGRSDIFVAPALLESFGIAALEARCTGLPVVAHARSGVRDFIQHGREGLLADGDDDMARAVAQLAVNASLRRQIGQHNRAVRPEADWPFVMRRCEELYARAAAAAQLGHRSGGRPVAQGRREPARVAS
jgi:glycosyltransferase involved in cell wall biosynthesis